MQYERLRTGRVFLSTKINHNEREMGSGGDTGEGERIKEEVK